MLLLLWQRLVPRPYLGVCPCANIDRWKQKSVELLPLCTITIFTVSKDGHTHVTPCLSFHNLLYWPIRDNGAGFADCLWLLYVVDLGEIACT